MNMKHTIKTLEQNCSKEELSALKQELLEIYSQKKKFQGGVIDKAIWLFVGELLGEE